MKIPYASMALIAGVSVICSSCAPSSAYVTYRVPGGVSAGMEWTNASYDSDGFPIFGYSYGRPVYGYTAAGVAIFSIAALTALCFVPHWAPASWYRGPHHYPHGIHRVAAPPRFPSGHKPGVRPPGGIKPPPAPSHVHAAPQPKFQQPKQQPKFQQPKAPQPDFRQPKIQQPKGSGMNHLPGDNRNRGSVLPQPGDRRVAPGKVGSQAPQFGSAGSKGGVQTLPAAPGRFVAPVPDKSMQSKSPSPAPAPAPSHSSSSMSHSRSQSASSSGYSSGHSGGIRSSSSSGRSNSGHSSGGHKGGRR